MTTKQKTVAPVITHVLCDPPCKPVVKTLPLAVWSAGKISQVLCPKCAYKWHLQLAGALEIRRDCREPAIIREWVKRGGYRGFDLSRCHECQLPGRLSR